MSLLVRDESMPKKKHGGARQGSGRPSTGRDDVAAKIERPLANKAKVVADHLGQPMAQVISDAARANINRLYLKAIGEMKEEAE